MAGLARAGWQLVYTPVPSETFLQNEADSGLTDLDSSIGIQLREDGTVRSVVWNGPAFQVGLRPGVKVIKVNGEPFTAAVLLAAITHSTERPISITLRVDGAESDVNIAYVGPLRYPSLQRIPGTPDRLTQLLKSRSDTTPIATAKSASRK
jgi:predicted metalloprotease with PDZ domain